MFTITAISESIEVTIANIRNCSMAWDKFYEQCDEVKRKKLKGCKISCDNEELAFYPDFD